MEVSNLSSFSLYGSMASANVTKRRKRKKKSALWCLERPLSADAFRFRSYVYLPFGRKWVRRGECPPLTPLKPGLLRASTDSINFGTFPRGFSATQTITIVNNGQIAINFDAITLTGHNETFNLGDQPTSLGVKDNDIIEITFSPTTVGEFESQIQFEFDGENTLFSSMSSRAALTTHFAHPAMKRPQTIVSMIIF